MNWRQEVLYIHIYLHTDAGKNITFHHLWFGGNNSSATADIADHG